MFIDTHGCCVQTLLQVSWYFSITTYPCTCLALTPSKRQWQCITCSGWWKNWKQPSRLTSRKSGGEISCASVPVHIGLEANLIDSYCLLLHIVEASELFKQGECQVTIKHSKFQAPKLTFLPLSNWDLQLLCSYLLMTHICKLAFGSYEELLWERHCQPRPVVKYLLCFE